MISNHPHSNRCVELFKQLSAYIDGELKATTCKEIETHLAQCPPCTACLETLKRTAGLCRQMGAAAVPKTLSFRLKNLISDLSD